MPLLLGGLVTGLGPWRRGKNDLWAGIPSLILGAADTRQLLAVARPPLSLCPASKGKAEPGAACCLSGKPLTFRGPWQVLGLTSLPHVHLRSSPGSGADILLCYFFPLGSDFRLLRGFAHWGWFRHLVASVHWFLFFC